MGVCVTVVCIGVLASFRVLCCFGLVFVLSSCYLKLCCGLFQLVLFDLLFCGFHV